jgi:uncharacterized iron-regulated membrane protein
VGAAKNIKIVVANEDSGIDMIDNYAEAMKLIQKMKAHLPFTVRPTRATVQSLRQSGAKIRADQDLRVDDVVYLGDEGGIACTIYLPEQKTATITSVTHLDIPSDHPLAEEIKAYQARRTQKLAQSNGPRRPTRFTVKPRRKRKKR